MQRSDPFVLEPSQGRPNSPNGFPFKVLAKDSAGRISIHEWSLEKEQTGPHLHAHNFDEAFYILAGDLEMQIGGERKVLSSGYLAWVPRNTPHAFTNAGSQSVRVLTIATPGGLENVFAKMGGDETASLGDIEVEFLGPPIESEQASE